MTPDRSIIRRLFCVWMIVLSVTVAVPAYCQVRQSYFERSAETLKQIESMPEADRLRVLASDRLAAAFEEAMDSGNYRDAIGFAAAQVTLREDVLGVDHPLMIPALINHGFACWRQSRFAEGESSLRRARKLIDAHLGPTHPEMARCLDLLGLCRMLQGYHEEAKALYFDALRIALETCGELHEITIACYDDLGAVFQEQSRLARSEPFRRKALALSRQLNGTEHLTTARLTHNLGKLVIRVWEYAAAEALFREAMEIRIRLLGREHPDVAASMECLGESLAHQSRLDEAETYLHEALEIRRKTLGEEHHLTAINLSHLSHVCSRRGELKECLRYLHEELALRRRIHSYEHPNVVRCLRNIASVHIRMGQYDLADKYIDEARALVDKPALESFSGWYVDSYRSRIAVLRGDYRRAERIYEGMTTDFEEARQHAATDDRRTTYKTGGNPYLGLAAMRLLNGRPDDAWPAMERFLGRGLFELLVAMGDSPLSSAEIAREDSLDATLLGLEQQMAALLDAQNKSGASPGLNERIETIRTRLLEIQSVRGEFREYMRLKYPIAEGEVFPLDRVQAALNDETAVVGWLDMEIAAKEHAAWVYVIRSQFPVAWARLPVGGDGLPTTLPETFRQVLSGAAEWPYRVTSVDKPRWTGRQLYRQRLAPAEKFLEGVKNLVVIPTGAMQGIPVEALIDCSGRYASDRFTVSYTSSGTVYAWFRERAPTTRSPEKPALIVGDPAMAPPDDNTHGHFTPIPSSRREIESVSSALPGAVTLSGTDASEQALVALAARLGDFDTIHLATHACINPDRPAESYLVLSQADLPDPLQNAMDGRRIYDGRLTAREIVREWDLDAELVALSACQTALGKRTMGEGFVGFAHAFLQTGARSVAVSLWDVDDEATSLLMARFYHNMSGGNAGSRAAALSEAKTWLREYTDENGSTPYRHPAYWSAFILVGDSG